MAKKTILVRENGKGEFYIPFKDFSDVVDMSKVEYYRLTIKDKGSFIVTFYDKKKKLVKPNVTK
jgi:hypothetical protein